MALTSAERKKRYRERHPDRVAAQNRAWRERNPEKVKANNDRWNAEPRDRNPEAARRHSAAWYEKNKERRKELTAAWRAANPGKNSEYWRNRRARLLGSDPDLTGEQWQEILTEFEGQCAYCERDDVPLEQEHVVPLSRGGRHTRDNVVPACRRCNASKGSKLLAEWPGFV